MSGRDEPSGRAVVARLAGLTAAERTMLAALSIVGRAPLSGDEPAELAEIAVTTRLLTETVTVTTAPRTVIP
jgi:hypothetical protein